MKSASCWRKASACPEGKTMQTHAELASMVSERAHRLTGTAQDYDPLLDMIGNARFVLLGEASHGTHDFYRERAQITQRLIQEKGFTAVAVEADWPDASRVDRYVRGVSDDAYAVEALADYFDETRAVEPLERTGEWQKGEPPETHPFGV